MRKKKGLTRVNRKYCKKSPVRVISIALNEKNFVRTIESLSLHSATKKREFSSAGSEHLPYKQRVGGSNPSTPTKKGKFQLETFLFLFDFLFLTY
jgi:hypothetical protein